MNAPKPTQSLAGQQCPICRTGNFELVQTDYTEPVAEDNPITIRGLWVDRCTHCGEIVFPGDTVHFIESAVADQTEQLTPAELERIREDLGIETQDEMSEILGLGTKTYHKWESGKQFPTRSMSYYLRVLSESPQAFDWLRRRAWRRTNRIKEDRQTFDLATMFPDLASVGSTVERRGTTAPQQTSQRRPNPARGLTRVTFLIK